MLGMRILVSAGVIPALIALFWLDLSLGRSAWLLLALCLGIAARCSFELSSLLTVRTIRPSFPLALLLSLIVIGCGWLHVCVTPPDSAFDLLASGAAIGAGILFSFAVLMLWESIHYRQPGGAMESLGANLLTVMYAGVLPAVLAQFRWFPDPATGYFALAALIITVKSGDIGAYSFGRLWGQRKMAPLLSPGKTWMGGLGAVVGSLVGGLSWLYAGCLLFPSVSAPGSLINAAACSVLLGVIGLIGDLCESLIKRDCGRKDSAVLLPGFGGLLDLLDSPLFAGPFALAWWFVSPIT